MCLKVMVCFFVLSASVFSSILSHLRLIQEPSFYLNQASSFPCLSPLVFRISLCPRLLDRILFPIPCVFSLLLQLFIQGLLLILA
jgi:hypothetical protein